MKTNTRTTKKKNASKTISESSLNVSQIYSEIMAELKKNIVGQDEFLRDLIISLFGQGHLLIEGAPGLGKTFAVKTVAKIVDLKFSRIQFTPDLMPSDVVGIKMFDEVNKKFVIEKGPIFSNIVLADEINRSPAKVQSALLEAMEEKQATIGNETFKIDAPLMVLATQNPIEQEGTYDLPEAQMDRFFIKSIISYPSNSEEKEILARNHKNGFDKNINKIIDKNTLFSIINAIDEIFVSDEIMGYISSIISKSREDDGFLGKYVMHGISPRGGIALLKASKIVAAINGRNHVIPDDVDEMAIACLQHRIILKYEAHIDNINTQDIIKHIVKNTQII